MYFTELFVGHEISNADKIPEDVAVNLIDFANENPDFMLAKYDDGGYFCCYVGYATPCFVKISECLNHEDYQGYEKYLNKLQENFPNLTLEKELTVIGFMDD